MSACNTKTIHKLFIFNQINIFTSVNTANKECHILILTFEKVHYTLVSKYIIVKPSYPIPKGLTDCEIIFQTSGEKKVIRTYIFGTSPST